jgi:hypothetical protein
VVAPIVPTEFCFASVIEIREPVVCVELVIAAGVEDSAVPCVFARTGRDAYNRAGSLPLFGTVGVADHFELGDRVGGRIDQNRSP